MQELLSPADRLVILSGSLAGHACVMPMLCALCGLRVWLSSLWPLFLWARKSVAHKLWHASFGRLLAAVRLAKTELQSDHDSPP